MTTKPVVPSLGHVARGGPVQFASAALDGQPPTGRFIQNWLSYPAVQRKVPITLSFEALPGQFAESCPHRPTFGIGRGAPGAPH